MMLTPLTDREIQVLKVMCSGKDNKEIADTLIISEATVTAHIRNIYTKFQLSNEGSRGTCTRVKAVLRGLELFGFFNFA